jgi:predicted ester cyclase
MTEPNSDLNTDQAPLDQKQLAAQIQAAKDIVWQWMSALNALKKSETGETGSAGDATVGLVHPSTGELDRLVAADAVWHCGHPVNELHGRDAINKGWVQPLANAFAGIERRADIFMAGHFDGRFCGGAGVWVATTGHYCGTFKAPLFGIEPNHNLAFLRFGEFYRVENGAIVEARILVDLIDLLRQTGIRVLPVPTGVETLVPGPQDHAGLLHQAQLPEATAQSMALVESMIGGLHQFKNGSLKSMGMHAHWSEQMMWYGPAGIGSSRCVEGFQVHHQKPFLVAFPDRKGGNHRSRIAEGAYVASTGWPSITATHAGDYLGVPASNKQITMRVMDWWRVADDTLSENWVFIDLPHLMLQMGVDILARAKV